MSDIVLGTAGHIDHGKTSLIKALTGIETDRLKEEKLRGITIELGYAFLKNSNGKLIGIVDVPGHEKFIKNMVAGVTGIDSVMLIVAADEGVMPQTVEHIEICSLLGINHGFVVVTKTDTVDSDMIELVKEDIVDFKRKTFLENSPVFFVSSKTGEGIQELKDFILNLPDFFEKKTDNSYFILPIDRVFTKKGFGTVVTGTTVSGEISVGSDITVLPQNIEGKIRNIQVHGESVNKVESGHRTAINIQGISKEDIKRGNILTEPNIFQPSDLCDGYLSFLYSAKKTLKNRIQVKFYSGTVSVPAKVIILDKNELNPGENAFVQFVFDREIFNIHGEKFIIRSFDDKKTLGGGTVLDGSPEKKRRFNDENLSYLKGLMQNNIEDKINTLCEYYGKYGLSVDFLSNKLNIKSHVLKEKIINLNFIIFDKRNFLFISEKNLSALLIETEKLINDFHKKNPKQQGIPLEELRLKIYRELDFNLFETILGRLKKNKKIKLSNGIISSENFRIILDSKSETQKELVFNLLEKHKFTPPFLNQISKTLNIDEKELLNLINILIIENKVIKIKPDMYIEKKCYEKIKSDLIDFLKKHNEISIQDFKKIVNASRKYLIPLLEHFDSVKLTYRKGDKRALRN